MKKLFLGQGRFVQWLVLITLPVSMLFYGCGGGGTNSSEGVAVVLGVEMEATPISIEMVKDLTPGLGRMTIRIDRLLDNVSNGAGTVNLQRYTVDFERADGGSPGLPPVSGGLVGTISAEFSSDFPDEVSQAFTIVPAIEKLNGDLVLAILANPALIVEFDAVVTVFGRTLSGDNVQATTRFRLQAGVFDPVDPLLPSINIFTETKDLVIGEEYLASWNVTGSVASGALFFPWGGSTPLESRFFPVGSLTADTSFFEDDPFGTLRSFPSGVLAASNAFGTVQSTTTVGSGVTVYDPNVSDVPVSIDQFFADRTNINLGDTTNLTWVVSGGPTELRVSPDTYDGVTVNFSDKDLTFDTAAIRPQQSVRPILWASNGLTVANQFITDPIVVNQPTGAGLVDPNIEFFTASRTSVPINSQVALYWKITGDVVRAEIFPINGETLDVTGRETLLVPPLNQTGTQVFNLVVTGNGNVIERSTLTVSVTTGSVNEPVELSNIIQQPSNTIPNGTQGSFRFHVEDPERRESSWEVRKLAGDSVNFTPRRGRIPDGIGDDSVAFVDLPDNTNGFITFELSAFDDRDFGLSLDATRTIELVNFNVTDATVTPNAVPTITGARFVSSANADNTILPGQEGVLNFTISDLDTSTLDWRVDIVSGDFGGTLNGIENQTGGRITSGTASIAVNYLDDPDGTDDAVVFQISVTEVGEDNPQTTIQLVRVSFLDGGQGTISFSDIGLYDEGGGGGVGAPGTVLNINRLAFFISYQLSGVDPDNPQNFPGAFYRDETLSDVLPSMSVITDLSHSSSDPGQITSASFDRSFVAPGGNPENSGQMLFSGYFAGSGVEGGPGDGSANPITNGISRWYFSFNVESFRANTGVSYNLPSVSGETRDYQIFVVGTDNNNLTQNTNFTLRVEAFDP